MSVNMSLGSPVSINLGNVDDAPVAKGWHTVKIERAEADEDKKGNPQISVLARVTNESDPDNNKTIPWYLTFNGDLDSFQMKIVRRSIEALGLPLNLDYPTYQDLGDALIGLSVDAYVTHREWEGETKINVNKFRPISLLGMDDVEF